MEEKIHQEQQSLCCRTFLLLLQQNYSIVSVVYTAHYRLTRIIDLGMTVYRPPPKLRCTSSVDCHWVWAMVTVWTRVFVLLQTLLVLAQKVCTPDQQPLGSCPESTRTYLQYLSPLIHSSHRSYRLRKCSLYDLCSSLMLYQNCMHRC